MNNNTANATSVSSAAVLEFIQEEYSTYIEALVDVSALTLLFYATMLALPQEVAYMWLSPKPFSIPNLFYAFTRYGSLINQALAVGVIFSPFGSLCNTLAYVSSSISVFVYIGLQGLLIIRAYSLCQGHKAVAGALALLFLGGLVLFLYSIIVPGGCYESYNAKTLQVFLAESICIFITDLLAFCTCLWKVWGTWKLKREIGNRSTNDLVSVLLKQAVSRFSFVIVITLIFAIIDGFMNSFIVDILIKFQHSLSAILLADFTLDLRQQNSAAIQATNVTLPSIRFQSVVNYIHQSILVEMGDSEHINTREGGGDEFSGYPDGEIRHEELVEDQA